MPHLERQKDTKVEFLLFIPLTGMVYSVVFGFTRGLAGAIYARGREDRRLIVVLIGLTCLLAACGDSGASRQEVADYVGGAVAANLEGPVQDLARSGDTNAAWEALDGLVDSTLDDLEVPSGVSRLMEGSGIGWHHVDGAAWVSTSVLVVPKDDPADPYCVAIGVHSDGRVITRPSSADPINGCAGAREGDFD